MFAALLPTSPGPGGEEPPAAEPGPDGLQQVRRGGRLVADARSWRSARLRRASSSTGRAAGKAMHRRIGLYVPVLGKLLRKIETTRFARTLSALLDAGVDVGSSLDLTADVLRLAPYRRAVARAHGRWSCTGPS